MFVCFLLLTQQAIKFSLKANSHYTSDLATQTIIRLQLHCQAFHNSRKMFK